MAGRRSAWKLRLEAVTPDSRALVQERLAHWLEDPDLSSLRDEVALVALPEGEKEACRALWAEAAKLLARARQDP